MNNHIICDVSSCLYNENRACSATEVEVNNDPKTRKDATTSKNTECSTFVLK